MKNRIGFISNSSSSSFIVFIKDGLTGFFDENEDVIANEKDESKLDAFGFFPTSHNSPFRLEMSNNHKKHHPNQIIGKGYCVSCNEDEVIDFLVQNNIPFKASCHYGHRFVQYKRDSDYILFANNYGMMIDMYGEDAVSEKEIKHITIVSVKEYLGETQ